MLNKKDYYILLSLTEIIEKILRYSSAYSNANELYENDRDYDAIMMNFIVIGEAVGKLSNKFRSEDTKIDWNKIYALRNIVAHHYFGINIEIVWQVIQNDIPILKLEINKILNTNS